MKSIDKNKMKKTIKKKQFGKPKKEKVLIVAQEFKFAKLLSGNEKTIRDRVLKSLKRWLLNCFSKNYVFKEDDFIRVWKGLFYAVWMSDKPLVQEDLCESISHVLDLFPNDQFEYAMLFTKVGFKVLATEWYGIDQHRFDKFLMLIRRYLRGSIRCLLRKEWDIDSCKEYAKMLSSGDGVLAVQTPFYARNSISMILQIIECFLEELAKMSQGKITNESLIELLDPFIKQVCIGEQHKVYSASRNLLLDLLKQSDLGLKYAGATAAWKKMGCPVGGPDAFELISDNEDEGAQTTEENHHQGPLDPRAGQVDVVLDSLPVPSHLIAERIRQHMKKSASKAYKRANTCLKRFEQLSNNDYPLKIRTEELEAPLSRKTMMKSAANLKALEKNLVLGSDELALRGLSRKHRKRLLAKSRSGVSIVNDDADKQNVTNEEIQTKNEESNKLDEKVNSRKRKNKDAMKSAKKPKLDLKKKNEIEISKNKNKENEKEDKTKSKVIINKKDNVLANKKEYKNIIIGILNKKENVLANKKDNKNLIVALLNKKDNVLANKKENKNVIFATGKNNAKQKAEKKKETVKPEVSKDKTENNIANKGSRNANNSKKVNAETPKRVKFVLKNNSMQGPVDYYNSVRQSPSIPFDSSKIPVKTNLKPSTPSPINPFIKKKLRLK